MWPDRVSNPGPPTYESGALPIALRGPARVTVVISAILFNTFLRYSSLSAKRFIFDIVRGIAPLV